MKVFVTVGSMLPFDRLISMAVEMGRRCPGVELVLQVGQGGFLPDGLNARPMMSPTEFRKECLSADVIVSHAGMGTILTALELGRQVICLPRRPDLSEVTSAHQIATCGWLKGRRGIHVVDGLDDLVKCISEISLNESVDNINGGENQEFGIALENFVRSALNC